VICLLIFLGNRFWLKIVGGFIVAVCALCGVGVGIVASPFWGFTTSWYGEHKFRKVVFRSIPLSPIQYSL
jgi:hypothetical protein